MASIKKIEGKTGTSYKITVAQGKDAQGKQIRHYKTWKPDRSMTAKQAEKEVRRVAYEFEKALEQGFQVDDRQTFDEYAQYVIQLQEQRGVAPSTLRGYRYAMKRIGPAFGHMKLRDIKPQTINNFYRELMKPGSAQRHVTATPKAGLVAAVDNSGMGRCSIAQASGITHAVVCRACSGGAISAESAEGIAKAIGRDVKELFSIECDDTPLSNQTIRIHHGLISIVFAQAEKEMLIQYNPAARATPPPVSHETPSYLQPDDLTRFLDRLEGEPIKWQTMTYFLAVTGCRIGEALGLKWEKVDFENGAVRIDTSMNHLEGIGVYEGPTKTRKARYAAIPAEMISRLKKYRARQAEHRLMMGDMWRDSGLVFPREDGAPMSSHSYRSWLYKFCDKNGFPRIHPHSLRHTFASVLIAEGVDVVTVANMMGHANTNTTLSTYSHVIEESKRKATECIADVILRKKKA